MVEPIVIPAGSVGLYLTVEDGSLIRVDRLVDVKSLNVRERALLQAFINVGQAALDG